MQVGCRPDQAALNALQNSLIIQVQRTLPARAETLADPGLPERDPPIRQRASIPTSWLQLELREGRNRQVRRMTAAVGLPTLRLLRVAIDLMDGGSCLDLSDLAPGQWRPASSDEEQRLTTLLRRSHSPGRGGRAGGGKSGRGGGGG